MFQAQESRPGFSLDFTYDAVAHGGIADSDRDQLVAVLGEPIHIPKHRQTVHDRLFSVLAIDKKTYARHCFAAGSDILDELMQFPSKAARSINDNFLRECVLHYSAVIPASLTNFCHLAMSAAMNCANFSGVPPVAVNPCLASVSTVFGCCKISFTTAL